MPDWSGLSAFILSLVGVGGLFTGWLLNRRGQEQQAIQQVAANDLASRAQGFTEMKLIVETLKAELTRVGKSKDAEVAALARSCHLVLDHFVIAFTALQGQVVAEAAKRAADLALLEVEQHNANDHPEK